jgi:isopenicillin-N N-acyltransferase-like protein
MRTSRCALVGALVVLLPLSLSAAEKKSFRFPEGKHAGAQLKYINGVPVLITAGTPEQMGTAVGVLAVKPGMRALGYPRDLLRRFHFDWLWPTILKSCNNLYRQFPVDYKKELEALVKGSGASHDEVVIGNTLFDLKKIVHCSALLIEERRSSTGGPLLGRNLDYPSLGYIHEYSLVTVYRPRGKHAFATIGFPGLVGCLTGINDAGLCLGVLEVFAARDGEKSFDNKGIPYGLCHRRLLEECTTIAEARKLLESMPRTTMLNLAIADRKGVAVFEITPGRVVQRAGVRGVCSCTNHFCTKVLKPAKALDYSRTFERFDTLEKLRDHKGKIGPEDLRRSLHAANLRTLTLQTMVLEPRTLRLHLSIGKVPASAGPLRTLDLAPLFKGEMPK